MKKWIGLLVVILLAVGGWWATRTYARFTPEWDKPKLEKIVRGDLRVPITAAGLIEPKERIEIKPEASGEVLEVRVREGDRVKPGDVLVVLKKLDEERNVARAQDNLKRAQALLAQAQIAIESAEAQVSVQEANVAELTANGRRLADDLRKEREMKEGRMERTLILAETAVEMNDARLQAANAQVKIAQQNHLDAKQAVNIQEAAVSQADKDLKEAEQRLSETTIVSRFDAIITKVNIEVGNIVQSGKQSFTGGSVLLEMSDVSKLKVVTRVDEADYGRVVDVSPIVALPDMEGLREAAEKAEAEKLAKRSGKVTVTVEPYPNDTFEGVIERVEPQGRLNPGQSVIQFDVHVEITDPKKGKLPLGTQAQVEFTVESVKDALLIPTDAVKTEKGEKGVWIPGPKDVAGEPKPKFVPCRFGITDGNNTQLVNTLDGTELKQDIEVYTKLPVNRDEDKKK